MKRVTLLWVIVGILTGILLVSSFASAETLTFDQSATAGNTINATLDIVKIGAYTQGDYQYFYFETRSAGLNQPASGDAYVVTIDVEANVNGNDETEYLYILLMWSNDNGHITPTYHYTLESSSSMLTDNDVTVSGARVTVRVPAISLQNVDVLNVDFITSQPSAQSEDEATYDVNSGGNSGDGGSTSDDSYDNTAPAWAFWALGLAWVICLGIWFIIWLLVALWAYKDAKNKCNEHPGLWFLVVFFLGIIGIIIYVIVVKDECQKQQAYVPPPPPQ